MVAVRQVAQRSAGKVLSQLDQAVQECALEEFVMTAKTKTMPKRVPKAKSPIFESVHETAADLHSLGFIDQRKMRKYDLLCRAPQRRFAKAAQFAGAHESENVDLNPTAPTHASIATDK